MIQFSEFLAAHLSRISFGLKEETLFTHFDDDGTQTTIAVDRLSYDKRVQALKIFDVPVERQFADLCIKKRGVEQHRLDRLMNEKITQPVVFCDWPDGSHLLVDGTHRYVATAAKGINLIAARIVPENIWRDYVIVDYPKVDPDAMIKTFSGIE